MSERLEKRSGEFNNQDLLGYFKTIQEVINKSDRTLDNVDVASIQIQQNQINLKVDAEEKLDVVSKMRVSNAIKSILAKLNNTDNLDEKREDEELEVVDDR